MDKNVDRLKAFIDSGFLINLEYHLSKEFKNFRDENVKYFWCDGISLEENIYTASTIEAKKQIVAKAWIGVDGQDIYTMIIILGKRSFTDYLNETEMGSSLPEGDILNWLTIQPDDKTIEVRLD